MIDEKGVRITIARILGAIVVALILSSAARAQEMTGQVAEKKKKELLDLETSTGKNLATGAADWQDHFCVDACSGTLREAGTSRDLASNGLVDESEFRGCFRCS
jgi:hypothetical protein